MSQITLYPKRFMSLVALCTLALWFSPSVAEAQASTKRKTENVIFVMTDGLRWQEVFAGAEDALLNASKQAVALRRTYGGVTTEARRETLLPFFWNVIAKEGQIYGNRTKNSDAFVTNGLNFSYPGYNETLTGFPDKRINSNAKVPNPNVTVLEWLHNKPKYRGKVAAFGAWDVFPSIFNRDRCGFLVNAGYEPLEMQPTTPRLELLNRLKAETPRKWEGEPYDSFTFHTAMEYLKAKKPRVLFLSLGETDEWAHEGDYREYLDSAKRVDAYVKFLWETLQSMAHYRGKTTLIFLPDHGRGDAPEAWKSHASIIKGSEFIWMAFLGPDTSPMGERNNIAPVTQNQIAATLAALLGEDYNAAEPKAGKPLVDVLRR